MFSNIIGFSIQLFSAIVLLLITGIVSHVAFGLGTQKSRNLWVALILLLMGGVQLFYLINASVNIPADQFFIYNQRFHRSDCIDSSKGGKRPLGSQATEDRNPCFCNPVVADCWDVSAGTMYNGTSCPRDSATYASLSPSLPSPCTASQISPYLSYMRDCEGGRAKRCTREQPCTPCEIGKVAEFGSSRCRTCSTENQGDCNFVPDVGPYCLVDSTSRRVEPCRKWCSESAPLIVNNMCY